ncbi:HNH endonuclease signature motif containing protein [Pseudomonas fluvialis]|uniref:HNH endonuclease signature motif containing protein n=1 Tax=Pseudomonas fluvialis TaxID=1793966 RepID=UPI0035AE8526
MKLDSALWLRLRAQVLAEQPLCAMCTAAGLVTPATEVDHINNDGDDNSRGNLQGLCCSCHSHKTHTIDAGRLRHGCDVSGIPLDPAHPWRREEITSNRSRPNDGGSHTYAAAEKGEAEKWQA